jgi:GMP synthase (glutamine-hydrolysing)
MSLSILVVVHADDAPAGLLLGEAERLGHRLQFAYARNTGESDAFAALLRESRQHEIGCDALVILGGPMSSCDERQYPHYRELLALIRVYASAGRAILGLCLGAQLIARAFGASVFPMGFLETRCEPLILTVAGQGDPLLRDLPKPLKPMQWHYDTFEIPKDAVALVEGSRCLNQGFFIKPAGRKT